MSRYLKLIWFAEDPWTKVHAAVGINAQKTLCGIVRSTRPILSGEKDWHNVSHFQKCLKCRAALRHRYGFEDVVDVKVE